MSDLTCARGHVLQQKVVAGDIFGGHFVTPHKCCQRCHVQLEVGRVRHSCKKCDYHLCARCHAEMGLEKDKLPGRPGLKCPRGHTIADYIAPAPGLCDGCGTASKPGQHLMDCRTCNWYLCDACSGRGRPPLTRSSTSVSQSSAAELRPGMSVTVSRCDAAGETCLRSTPSGRETWVPGKPVVKDGERVVVLEMTSMLFVQVRTTEGHTGFIQAKHLSACDSPKAEPAAAGYPRSRAKSMPGPLPQASQGAVPCKFGASCYNHDPLHRARFTHPETQASAAGSHQRRACRFGSKCYQKKAEHLREFVHPGDRNYRLGWVVFPPQTAPDFETLWQIFTFFDPDESGQLSIEEFQQAEPTCKRLAGVARDDNHDQQANPFSPVGDAGMHVTLGAFLDKVSEDVAAAWKEMGGDVKGYVNFNQFSKWCESIGISLPFGIDASGASRPCRFKHSKKDGERCSCPGFDAVADGLCSCGHKESMHRSDFAERSGSKLLGGLGTFPPSWQEGEEGLVQVKDSELLAKMQALLTHSHKTSHNWTRDRGCKLHGVNGCSLACADKNKVQVPTGYTLVSAFRNQNVDLWQNYVVVKSAVAKDCDRDIPSHPYEYVDVTTTSVADFDGQLDRRCNEWRLLHGSDFEACQGICSTNYRLKLAGTGATWKDPGKAIGTPLYGFGIYFSERITKADEYAEAIPEGQEYEGMQCVMLNRILGGRCNIIETNEIDVDQLRREVFHGPYHSVFGDREKKLGKPYREVVVYDKDQCYPEFMLIYKREYG